MYKPVCILVMAHSHQELLLNLLEKIEHPDLLVFVHIDKKSQPLFEVLRKKAGINLVQNRVDVKWAHITQVEAMFASYREIRKLGHSFDHFIVISGQDYPIKPVGQLIDFLHRHKNKSLISYIALSKDGWANAMKRFRYHYYVRMEKILRGLMMMTGIRRKIPFDLKPYGGAQWVNLATVHMDHVIEFCEKHVSLMKFMETVRFPEEMLFQTLLLNSQYKHDLINNDLRYVKWMPAKSNPEILTESLYDEILKSDQKFFARKFDLLQSATLLKKINSEIHDAN